MTATVLRADALALPLANESVDLVVTSPPYFSLRSYTDGGQHYAGQLGSEATPAEFVDALLAATREMVRVLKPSGSIWINLGDKYSGAQQQSHGQQSVEASSAYWQRTDPKRTGIPNKSLMGIPWRYALACIDTSRTGYIHTQAVREVIDDLATGEIDQRTAHQRIDVLEKAADAGSPGLGLILRAEVIWSKPNGLPESVTDRVRRSHEQWFMFTREPRYYSAVDEVREAQEGKRDPSTYRLTGRNGADPSRHKGIHEPGVRSYTTVTPQAREYNPLGKLPGSVWTIPTEPLTVPPFYGVLAGRTVDFFWTEAAGVRWMRRVGVRHGRPSVRRMSDHFAAFPTEFPRRIIAGWSPPGICVGCGEGRRPVAAAEYIDAGGRGNEKWNRVEQGSGDYIFGSFKPQEMRLGRANRSTTITGYVCACPPEPADREHGSHDNWPSWHLAGECGWQPPTRPAIVLDPFGGTGTVALVADVLGRTGIGVDLSADYNRLAAWRTTDPGQRAKAARVEKPPPVIDGQLALEVGT
jgi:DNA modification methylase